jgi:long-chain acyl-CoA synthetase
MSDGRILVGPPIPEAIRSLSGETLVDLLDLAVARNPDAPVFVMPRGLRLERWTYRDLGQQSRRIAKTLVSQGVGSGDRVITWAANDPWLVAAYFAVWRLGAVVVPLDLRMATEIAIRIGRAVEPTLTMAGPDVAADEAAALGAPVVGVDAVSLTGESGTRLSLSTESEMPTAAARRAVAPDTLAEILFTSGTTSDPKGAMLTHAQLVHSARTIAITAGIRRERALALIPLSHTYGQIVPLLYGLMSGTQLTFLPSLTPSALLSAMRRDRITALTAVPQLLRLLMDGIEAEAARRGRSESLRRLRAYALHLPMPLRRAIFRSVLAQFGGELRTITCGGAMLPAELQLAWEALGIAVVQGYGATECATITGHTRTSRRPGTVGPPLAGMQVSIAEDGEVLVRGPGVMLGYWAKPEQTAEVIVDGWAHSGDAAEIDPGGDLVIRGRTRDRIALPNGLKVYPEDVEAAIVESGPVGAAVLLEASPGTLVAVLLPRESGTTDADLEAAIARANASLSPHQRVRRWVRWTGSDFPRTHTLKVRRGQVEEWYGRAFGTPSPSATQAIPAAPAAVSGEAAAASGPDAAADLLPALIRLVGVVVESSTGETAGPISPSTSLDELGLDSLGRVGLALQIEDAFGASLDDSEMATAADLAELARVIANRRGAAPPSEPPRWAHAAPARFARHWLDRIFTGPLVSIVARPSADGLENLYQLPGPVLICPNHASHLDAPSVRYVLTGRMRDRTAIAAAADYFFGGRLLGPVVALATGAFPFGRTEHVRASLGYVSSFLDANWNVILFPEGTRSPTGRLGPFKSGIGLLATQLGVPVVPVGIRGAHDILPKGAKLPRRRGRVRLSFGRPLTFEPGCTAQEATARIEAAVRALVEREVPPRRRSP